MKLIDEEEESFMDLTLHNLNVGISHIKDKRGFEEKVENRLGDMLNPQNFQIFQVEDSKKLYQVVNKHL